MARKSPSLIVNYTRHAIANLDKIWSWNAETYDIFHADSYVKFLKHRADLLYNSYDEGSRVVTRPDYRYVTAKRSNRGHGHLIIYLITGESVEILAFLHTRQDWQGKIERGEV